jgi:hypothetical protein
MSTQPNQTDQSQAQKSSSGRQDQSQQRTGNDRPPSTDQSPQQNPNQHESDTNSDVEGNKPQRSQDEKIRNEKDQEKPARTNEGKQDDLA